MIKNTVFFGNGLNYIGEGKISWTNLLQNIKGKQFDDNLLPNTLTYERIILDKYSGKTILSQEYYVKEEIADLMRKVEPSSIYESLYTLNFENYITTNYDYGFIISAERLNEVNSIQNDVEDSEKIYSIRRVKRISNKKEKKKLFWQIHGEIDLPASIMLGLDQYCKYIRRIAEYFEGRYTYTKDTETIKEKSMNEKILKTEFSGSSWIELFFTTNVHIIGFSLDFCEIDLWWLLNKRARMKKSEDVGKHIKNEIHFYCPEESDPEKKKLLVQKTELLKSFGVIVHIHKLNTGKKFPDLKFYEDILNGI